MNDKKNEFIEEAKKKIGRVIDNFYLESITKQKNMLYFPTHDDPLGQISVVEKYEKTGKLGLVLMYALAIATKDPKLDIYTAYDILFVKQDLKGLDKNKDIENLAKNTQRVKDFINKEYFEKDSPNEDDKWKTESNPVGTARIG